MADSDWLAAESKLVTCQTGSYWVRMGCLLVAWLALAASAFPKHKQPEPSFQYAGGTEKIARSFGGNLEVTAEALVFKCPLATVTMPFASISFMEFRSDISQRVRKLQIHWQVYPEKRLRKQNRYFTVVYKDAGETHILVLQVAPSAMRPYLAEIELKSGKRVEVMGYEEYP